MDIDGDELNGYLGAGYGDLGVTHSTAEHVAAAATGQGFPQADEANGGADMDAMVAEGRRSLANGFGLDYLTMGDDDSFSAMVQSPFSMPRLVPSGPSPLGVPTTLQGVMDMTAAPSVGMGMFGPGPAMPVSSEMQPPNMSMFMNRTDNIAPGVASQQPDNRAPSSAMSMGPQQPPSSNNLLSSDIAMGPPPSNPSPVDETMLEQPSRSAPGMMSGSEPQTINVKPSAPLQPTPSIFPGNIYSSSGFDMLDILNRVANRPNPEINIGAVDMSCAFVVTDVRKFDNPIVYCSATFERLTGYTKHEILGRNCRFLQAPDGNLKAGDRRKYVDENTAFYLKQQIAARAEAQTSLINYRKGGQSFTNLLTMIPIPYNDEVVYFVGFQVDLVEQPSAMLNKNQDADGSYVVNYQYSELPSYIPAAAVDHRPKISLGRDDVSQVLTSFDTGNLEVQSKRILDKVLLENTDDVVHVLSLKGLFLYCSPSIRKVLEYEPHELVGTSLSGVCHPSDIVPVTRDLKDTSNGANVNVVFRIRRKFSGYTWFESHGCLHTEQGKGRKCVILVGRERPVYMLSWKDVNAGGGIGESELWTKLSASGMFLHVASNSKALLDREAEELVGTSVQALMRPDSRNEVDKALETARTGNRTTVRHEIQNKRGQFLQALTTLYPGDGNAYHRPTFLIAQTRLLKHTRGSGSAASPRHKATAVSSDTLASHRPTPGVWGADSSTQRPTVEEQPSPANPRPNSSQSPGADDSMFEELKTTRSTSWQFELRQMQRTNKRLVEELNSLLASKKKRKRRKGVDQLERDCANCHTRVTPEWRRGPSGKRDLCNSCGLRFAKLQRGSSRTAASTSDKGGGISPLQAPPLVPPAMAVELSPSSAPAPSAPLNAKQQSKPISASSTSDTPTIQQSRLPPSNQEAPQIQHEGLPRNSAPDSPTVDAAPNEDARDAASQASVFRDSGGVSLQFVGLPIAGPSSRTQPISPSGMSALRSGVRSAMSSNGGSTLDTAGSNNNGPHPMGADGGVG